MRRIFLQLILCFFFLFSSMNVFASSFFGESGGIKNEGDYPVKIQLIRSYNVYEWVLLARGDSYDFSIDVEKVLFRYVDQRALGKDPRLILYHGDGSSLSLLEENREYNVIR